MKRWILFAAFTCWLPSRGLCICSGQTSFCEKLPDRADRNSAIFVGTVTQVRGSVVRFKVSEAFLNASLAEMEVAVTSDLYVDGVPQGAPSFAIGREWLVEAGRRNENQPWTTTSCSRTKAMRNAAEDLKVLRAWAAGQDLPARISGEVWDPAAGKNIPGIQIDLAGGPGPPLSTTSDERGQFAFDGLASGQYQAVALLPSGAVRRDLDLTRTWCPRVVFLVK
jgi:hypothetical protein